MSIRRITEQEFNDLKIQRIAIFPERSWFQSSEIDIAGTVIRDTLDKDWSYVVLAKDEDGVYRHIEGAVSIPDQNGAEDKILEVMSAIEERGTFEEAFYAAPTDLSSTESELVISSIDDEIKKYFKDNPEKLYDLAPRKFEELVASILEDLGFEVELTKTTRDGGRDIIAHVRNAVCSYLTHIECKRYAPDNRVGVGIIREVLGVHQIRQASKSVIVTTSFFSGDAVKEAELMKSQLDLKDFNDLKAWLQRY